MFSLNYLFIIDNSTGFEAKMQRALSSLARILNMPEPKEIERKFLIHNFQLNMIPADAVAVEIRQDYLMSTGTIERRVRSRTLNGSSSYYYTEKVPTAEAAERIEREREISRREYEDLLRERDSALEQIQKTRYCFDHAEHHLELDVYGQPVTDLAVLEVELRDKNEPITLPEGWQVKEVTQNSRYKNHAIAAGSLK